MSVIVTQGHSCDLCGRGLRSSDLERGWVSTRVGLLLFCSECIRHVHIIDDPAGLLRIVGATLEERVAKVEEWIEAQQS